MYFYLYTSQSSLTHVNEEKPHNSRGRLLLVKSNLSLKTAYRQLTIQDGGLATTILRMKDLTNIPTLNSP